MSRDDLWKWLVLAFLTIFSLYVVCPPTATMKPVDPADPSKGEVVATPGKIRLGLDLSGGTSFTVAIDQDKLRENIKIANTNKAEMTDGEIEKEMNRRLQGADDRMIEIIRNRIDSLGVNEPVIQAGKDHRVTIQLPGISAKAREAAEKSIKSAAFLEFKLVHPKNSELVGKIFASGRIPEGFALSPSGRAFVPTTYEQLKKDDPNYLSRLSLFAVDQPSYQFMLERNVKDNEVTYAPYFVRRKASMDGTALSKAAVDIEQMTGKVNVQLAFNSKGSVQFSELTRKNVGRQLAIILDDTLYSAPEIKTQIDGGQAVISGSFTIEEAALLRNILNAGALPAPMKILEKRSVESTLGSDAIHSGLMAGILGLVLVMCFMFFYYRYCGLIANIALILDMVLLPAGLIIASNVLGIFVPDTGIGQKGGLTLPVITMPGIAGIVLTIGMAVDANVLIFERMREEAALGKSRGAAIEGGYGRAFLAIFDSNITTILTAAILFIVGAGPIRGFAITLAAGIIVSMFTALVATRLIFNATARKEKVEPYKMLQFLKNPKFDFMKYGMKPLLVSVGIAVVTLGIFFGRAIHSPASVMSVDFTGGEAMTFQFDTAHQTDISQVRKIAGGLVNDATIQYQISDVGVKTLLIKTSMTETADGTPVAKAFEDALNKDNPDGKFLLANEEAVGSEVGSDLKKAAVWATIFSLIGILLYITIRFELGFALGGVVALAHDALLVLGLYSFIGLIFGGRQVGLTIVAALLTIVGYSINDTIVIFDRIREDMRKDHTTEFKTLCNRAINSTLSRTLLTTMTTLIACLTLFIFGGGAINDFALAMTIGVLVGTYSSVFIAAPVMVWYYNGKRPSVKKLESSARSSN
ncbi:MAG: protein translocase subunit SecD [Kiritimatiellae bacterium]|nr:protein translocase subunit SecD [Kiritimatiellia bacterium]